MGDGVEERGTRRLGKCLGQTRQVPPQATLGPTRSRRNQTHCCLERLHAHQVSQQTLQAVPVWGHKSPRSPRAVCAQLFVAAIARHKRLRTAQHCVSVAACADRQGCAALRPSCAGRTDSGHPSVFIGQAPDVCIAGLERPALTRWLQLHIHQVEVKFGLLLHQRYRKRRNRNTLRLFHGLT